MLKNYFLIAWRNLLRSRTFSAINISGLAIGMAGAVLILLWIANEISYDRFHQNGDRLYEAWNRVNRNGKIESWNTTPKVLASTLQSDFPEVEQTARVSDAGSVLVNAGEKRLNASGSIVDSTFFQLFSFPLLRGSDKNVLNSPNAVVITESLAQKLFRNEEATGKTVRLNNEDNFTVTGVVKDLPNNTRFNFDFLLPWSYLKAKGWGDDFWGNNSVSTYVLLKPAATLASIEPKLATLRKRYDKEDPAGGFFLHPASRWRLYSQFENGVTVGGRITVVRMFGILAGFLLLIACINFMNLSTARSQKRAKEVGIRKVMGAGRPSLIGQFMGESVLLSLLAGVLALLLVKLCLPAFNGLVEKQLVLPYNSAVFWLLAIGFILVTGLLAGSYPAFFLSSFKPVKVLKARAQPARALVTPRKVLVVLQFVFAITLIISTLVVKQQINHAQARGIGYNRDALVYHPLSADLAKNFAALKSELFSSGAAVSVTQTSGPLTEGWSNTTGIEWPGKDPADKTLFDRMRADDAIAETAGFEIASGRDFDLRSYSTDSTAILLTESAVKTMNLKEPLGQIVRDNGTNWHVVGVMKDFILNSPFQKTVPTVIEGAKASYSLNIIHARLNAKNSTAQNLKIAEAIFKKHNPAYPFEPKFIDEEYAKKFDSEKRTAAFTAVFAGVSIFISCLGLFGLAIYTAQNRIKEIGVRKVLGASVASIAALLTKDFITLVLIAFVLAVPLAWWAMQQWLQSFAYRIAVGWWAFAAAGLGAVLIAVLTVGFQAIKAAIANPVKSLRTE